MRLKVLRYFTKISIIWILSKLIRSEKGDKHCQIRVISLEDESSKDKLGNLGLDIWIAEPVQPVHQYSV